MVFCNNVNTYVRTNKALVTILILIDGFLQLIQGKMVKKLKKHHNPYFNRWFSAIKEKKAYKRMITRSQSLF